MTRNDRFRAALDHIYKNGLATDQKEVAEKTGITETTLSRIVNDRVKKPSEETIRSLNEGFGFIFDPEYFRGGTPYLLMEDSIYYQQHPEENVFDARYIPYGQRQQLTPPTEKENAASLIDLAAKLIKEVEAIRLQLNQELAETRNLREQLSTMLTTISRHHGVEYSINHNYGYPAAVAEDSNNNQ